jgi:endonuclease-3
VATPQDVPEIAARLAEALGTPTWEPDLDPLSELIYNVVGQHTSGANTRRAYARLRERFPAWQEVAAADDEAIAAAIGCAGLARLKAPRIRTIVQRALEERDDADLSFLADMPAGEAMAWLTDLPGVGQTTAACVLLFGLGRAVMPVNTGVQRVIARLGLVDRRARAEDVQRILEAAVPPEDVYALHVNLVRFGRRICLPSEPLCAICPLNDLCDYFLIPSRRRK